MNQDILNKILSNRAITFGLGTVILIIILTIFAGSEAKTTIEQEQNNSKTSNAFTFADLNQDKKNKAQAYRNQIRQNLPVKIDKFPTTAQIETSIDIYIDSNDPPETVRFEIFGLSYMDQTSDPNQNPNAKAYIESYNKAMQELKSKNIDPQQLIFIYPNQAYIRSTISKWISDNKLKP